MVQSALKHAPDVAPSEVYVGDVARAWVCRISDFVCAQANNLLQLAPQVPRVDSDLL